MSQMLISLTKGLGEEEESETMIVNFRVSGGIVDECVSIFLAVEDEAKGAID